MNCQEVMELMQRHVDDDLNDQETSLMMDHVGRCPECAAMFDRLVRLSRGLEQMPRVEPPYNLVDAILPQLAAHDLEAERGETVPAASNGRRIHRPRQAWITRISGVVALGVVIAVFAFNGPFFSGMGGSSSQKEATVANDSASAGNSGGAYSLRSEAMSEGARTADPFNKELPSANQAPAAAPSAGSPQLGAGSDSSLGDGKAQPGERAEMDVKGFMVNPDEADNPPMSLKEAAPDVVEAVSPDGEWKAVLTDGTLQIFRASDSAGAAVFELAADTGTRSELAWQDDSKALNYTYTDADGGVHARSILVPEMKEIDR